MLWFIELTVNNDCVLTFIEYFTAINIPEKDFLLKLGDLLKPTNMSLHLYKLLIFVHVSFNQELFKDLSFSYFVRVMNYSFLKQLSKLVCSNACLQNNDVRTKMYSARWNKYFSNKVLLPEYFIPRLHCFEFDREDINSLALFLW